jgi:hypothetical protein
VTPQEERVLGALAWRERTDRAAAFPLRRVATAALGGDDQLAARVLADLDLQGCVRTDTMGWYSGSLTPKGRAVARLRQAS